MWRVSIFLSCLTWIFLLGIHSLFWYEHLYFLWGTTSASVCMGWWDCQFWGILLCPRQGESTRQDWDFEQSSATQLENTLVWLITIAVLSRDCPRILLHRSLFSQSGWFLLFFRLAFKPFLLVIYLLIFMYLFLSLFGQSGLPIFANKGSREKHPRPYLVDYLIQL